MEPVEHADRFYFWLKSIGKSTISLHVCFLLWDTKYTFLATVVLCTMSLFS